VALRPPAFAGRAFVEGMLRLTYSALLLDAVLHDLTSVPDKPPCPGLPLSAELSRGAGGVFRAGTARHPTSARVRRRRARELRRHFRVRLRQLGRGYREPPRTKGIPALSVVAPVAG
jgi:hypothetical protein